MKCSEETRRKISEAQKGKPRPYLIGRKITWSDKIVATRRKNNSYVISDVTREKMKISGHNRIMPRQTEEHKQRLRESNKKTWSDLSLRKKQSEISKIGLSRMSPEKKLQQIKNSKRSNNTLENKAKKREVILRLRQNPDWIRKSNEGRKGRIPWMKGKHHTIESRIKNSFTKKNSPKTPRGKNNPAYIDGKGNERRGERLMFHQTLEYRLFREEVLRRDNYTCQICGIRGGRLHVDHVKSYRKYPELRTDAKNGRVVCFTCHIRTPNYGRKEEYAL